MLNVSWTVSGGRVLGPAPFLVMGIVNVTPDSFSDGGRYAHHESAVTHALSLLDEGAAVVDVGGESTRPFADPVSADDECARVLPVIAGIAAKAPQAVISVDTYKAQTAAKALAAGAVIINDVSACAFDPELADVLAQHKPGYVLMHSQGRPSTMQVEPRYDDVLADIRAFFEAAMARLVKAGLPEDRIVLDPGIGFGKTLEHNLAILANLDSFAGLGRPVMAGLSNKSFLGGLLGLAVAERGQATAVATALAWQRGAGLHRVHAAGQAVHALTLARAMAERQGGDAKG